MKFGRFICGLVGLAGGLAIGFSLCLALSVAAFLSIRGRLMPNVDISVAASPAPVSPAPMPQPSATVSAIPEPPGLMEEVIRRQQAAAGKTGEIEWLKKRTGIDCSASISDEDCMPFLASVATEDDIIARVRELQATGSKVVVMRGSSDSTKKETGAVSEDGKLIFVYRNATPAEIRTFLLR
jgi:hypothetical protein